MPTKQPPLPGTRLTAYPPFEDYQGPPRMVVKDVPFYGQYREVRCADEEAFSTPDIGASAPSGTELRSAVFEDLRCRVCSEASITGDDVILYRQSDKHAPVAFLPDRASGFVIFDAEQGVTAEAYRVTGHARATQIWSRAALRGVIERCIRVAVIDWPPGWARLMPGGVVTFAPNGTPWRAADEYRAEPVSVPVSWGPRCAECGRFAEEHDPARAWFGCGNFRPSEG